MNKKVKETFLKNAREKYGDKFEYDLSNYVNRDSIIEITEVATGFTFKTTGSLHLKK